MNIYDKDEGELEVGVVWGGEVVWGGWEERELVEGRKIGIEG